MNRKVKSLNLQFFFWNNVTMYSVKSNKWNCVRCLDGCKCGFIFTCSLRIVTDCTVWHEWWMWHRTGEQLCCVLCFFTCNNVTVMHRLHCNEFASVSSGTGSEAPVVSHQVAAALVSVDGLHEKMSFQTAFKCVSSRAVWCTLSDVCSRRSVRMSANQTCCYLCVYALSFFIFFFVNYFVFCLLYLVFDIMW